MNTGAVKKITCIASKTLTPLILESLYTSNVRQVFIQRGKQICLIETSGLFGFFPRFRTEEERSDIIRFYAPSSMADKIASGMIIAADLQLPGRGSIFLEDALISADDEIAGELSFYKKSDDKTGSDTALPAWHDYSVLTCIVQRGQGNDIVSSVLDLGLCVPVVSFGQGMGLRNRLGLLRVTIPVEKEILYLVVPAADVDLVEGIAVHKAKLDKPGKGFIYRTQIKASVVNSRVRITNRRHVASMEQLISAIDDLQGSTNWRRLSAGKASKSTSGKSRLSCLSVVCDEGRVSGFVQAAMDAGAGGATLVQLNHQDLVALYSPDKKSQADDNPFHARESCDLIVPSEMIAPLLTIFRDKGLFDDRINGFVEVTEIDKAVTYQP